MIALVAVMIFPLIPFPVAMTIPIPVAAESLTQCDCVVEPVRLGQRLGIHVELSALWFRPRVSPSR